MPEDIKSLRTRIKSFDSTLHLTGAMGLVASSKIKRACDAMYASREFADGISEITMALAASPECRKSPYFGIAKKETGNTGDESDANANAQDEPSKTRLIVIAGDRGLCGGYNANVFRTIRTMEYYEIKPIGKRSYDKYHQAEPEDGKEDSEEENYLSSEHYSYEEALEEAKICCKDFLEGRIDKVLVVYNKYVSIMSQEPRVFQLLPLEKDTGAKELGGISEPSADVLLEELVPEYFACKLYALVRESFACEVAARRMAMDSAKKNAQQMIDDLKLEYNRARQSTITQEITEIVSGAGK